VLEPGPQGAPRPGTAVPIVVEHLGSLGALVVVSDEGLSVIDPTTVEAVGAERSLDPLTPVWRVDRLPAGERIGGPEEAARWRRDAQVLGGALLVGLAAATVDLAVTYAKGREQFGKPIGSFQAVKHMCADMLVRAEVARAAVHAAAVTIDQPDVGDAVRAAAGAGLLAVEAAIANGKTCIQVHGGMGFTWEVPAHLYLMRARVVAGALEGTGTLAEIVAGRY
jgi:alkylation response protein AidB-like acyl-CoA dehydrogenase